MGQRGLAYFLALLLTLAGAAAGLLWAAYVFYGLFTQTGVIEPAVIQFYGRPSLRIDALIAGLGALVYLLADWPRRWLAARPPAVQAPHAQPTAPARLDPPGVQGASGRFQLSVDRSAPSVPERAGRPPAPVQAATPPTAQGPGAETPKGRPGRLLGWLVTAAIFGGLYWYYAGPGAKGPSSGPKVAAGDPASSPPATEADASGADSEGALLDAIAEAQQPFDAWAKNGSAIYARELGTGARPRHNAQAVLAPLDEAAEVHLRDLAALVVPGPGPRGALTTRAAAYVAAARSLSAALDEAERYYGRGAPNDDGFAKGNALHAQVRAGQKELGAAAEALGAEVRRAKEARRARARAARVAGGGLRRVGAMDAVDQAGALFDLLVRRQERGAVPDATLKSALATYQATVDSLRGLARDVEGCDRELGKLAGLFPGVAQGTERFLRSARDAEREVRGTPGAPGLISQETGQRMERDLRDLARDAGGLGR